MAEREYVVSIRADAKDLQSAFKQASDLASGFGDGFRRGVVEGLQKGSDAAANFGEAAQKAGSGALSSFDSIALKITGLVAGLDIAGKALSAIGAGIEGVFAGITRGADFDDMAQRLGVAVEQLTSLELAARLGGVSMESLGTGLQILSRNMVEAASGGKEAQAAFEAVGIKASELANLGTDEVLQRIAERFSGAEDGAAKTALAMDLLGRSGASLIPVLNKGAEGLAQQAELAQRLGLVISTEMAQAMGAAADAVDILGLAVTGVQNQLAVGMAPALAALSAGAIELVSNLGIADGGVRDFGAAIGSAIVGGVDSALGALNTFVETVYSLGIGDALLQVFGAAFLALEELAAAQGRVIGLKFVQSFASAVDALLDSIPGLMLLDKPFANLAQGSIDEATQQVRTLAASFSDLGQGSPELAKLSSALEAARAQLAQFDPSVQKNDAHVNAWRASLTGAAGALPNVAKGTDAAGASANRAADAIEKLRDRFEEQIRAQTESVEKMRGQNEALQQIIDGNLSAADAQSLLNDATGEAAAAAALAAGAAAEEAAALGNLAIEAAEAAQANRELQATRNAQVQTQYLEQEAAILEQVVAGTKDLTVAERELAVLREQAKDVTLKQAEAYITAKDNVEELRGRVQEMNEDVIHLGDVFKDSFEQAFDAVISGTRDFGDVLQGIGIGIGKRFFSAMLESKFKDFDPTVKANFLDLGEFGKSVFGGLFSGAGGGSGGGGGSALNLLGGGGSLGGGLSLSTVLGIVGPGIGAGGAYGGYGALAGIGTQLLWQGAGQALMSNLGQDALALLGGETFAGTVGDWAGNSGWFGGATWGGQLFGGGSVAGSFGGGAIGSAAGSVVSAGLGLGASFAGQATANAMGIRPLHGTEGQIHMAIGNAVAQIIGNYFAGPLGGFVLQYINEILQPLIFGGLGIAQPPLKGTMQRMAGESYLDSIPTFAGLQDQYGDVTRKFYRVEDAPWLPDSRASLGEDAMRDIGGFAAIFAQLFGGDIDNGGRVAGMTEEWTNILTDFFGRMDQEGEATGLAIRQYLSQAFREMGVDATDAMEIVNELAGNMLWSPGGQDTAYFGEQVSNVTNLGEAVRGTAAIFESELPPGVHIASLALQSMTRDGEKAFSDLDTNGRETLLNLSKDADNFDAVLAHLFEQGFTIDTSDFETRLKDITASAGFISEGISQIFSAPSVSAGIEAMGQQLHQTITQSVMGSQLEDLFKNTDIAASFEPVFAMMRQMQDGDVSIGSPEFMQQMAQAIAEGRANLQDYIPQLQAMREVTEQINEAIKEAFEPSPIEQFWTTMSDRLKENQDAIENMASSLFDTASGAELLNPGSGRDAAREAMAQTIDASAIGAAQSAASDYATKSPQGEQLAKLTTEFQYKVAAAFSDGVISGEEKADLTQLKAKMQEAGQVLADSVSGGAAALSDLFKADRLKENIDAATESLKSSVGSGVGSMFDVIKGGGSTEEGIAAFGESFRGSVRDNILQGMQEALVQSAIMEGALGTLMGELQSAVSEALEDGFISADEQVLIDGLAQGIGDATDATLSALEPTLNTLGGIAETVAGNTDKAEVKIADLNDATKDASYGVDEMARRAARNLEEVGDAIPPATVGALKDGMGALGEAFGDVGNGPASAIKDGIGALQDAFGGTGGEATAAEIKTGLEALRDAFGAEASPDEIGAGLEKIKAALGADGGAEGLAVAAGAVVSAFGAAGSGTGLAGATEAMRDALGPQGASGAANDVTDALRGALQPATDEVADALRGGFRTGLDEAEQAARKLADALSSVKFPGAAAGGTFSGGTVVVGERGPEVVTALDGGGFRVDPISRDQMHALLGEGTPGFANGGALIPIGRGGRTGPFGRPLVPPPPAPRRPTADDDGSEQTINVSFSFDSAIDEWIATGDPEALQENVRKSIGEGILEGMKAGLLASMGLEEFQEKVAKAIEDGASESELIAMGEEFAKTAEDAITKAGPAFNAVAETFGLKTEEEVEDAITKAAATAKDLIGGSLRSALRDPANLNYDTFSASLRQAIYGNIVDGMVDAFIDAAVIQGALAPMLAVITAQFANLGAAIASGSAEGIAAASAIILTEVGKIANIIDDPAFKAAIETLLQLGRDVADGLGLDLEVATDGINYAAEGFQNAADAAAEACTGECEAEQKLVTTQEKLIALDDYGRMGGSTDSYYENVERPVRSGVDSSLPDTHGGPRGDYGDGDWNRSREWRRERSRARRQRRWHYDDDAPWQEPPHLAEGGIVTSPTYALIGEAGPEAVIPLSRGGSESDLVKEVRALRAELRAHGDKTVGAIQSDRHTEIKMDSQVLIDAWTMAKRVADKAGIPFGG